MTTNEHSALFLIPARGGSKGIPGKNIKPFMGKPLILHTLEAAREVAPDSDICLSTDSEAIAAVAREAGLEVPFMRPAELGADNATSHDVMIHALDWYRRERDIDYKLLVLLQPTSPLRTGADIRRGLELWKPGIEMVVSVKEAATNPYYNAYETDSNGFLHISKGTGLIPRRQDAPKVYEFNGAVYVVDTESLRSRPMGAMTRRLPFEMDRLRSVDLDTPLDWVVAETIARELTEARH